MSDEHYQVTGAATAPITLWHSLLHAIQERHPPTASLLRDGAFVVVDPHAKIIDLHYDAVDRWAQFGKNDSRRALVEGGIRAVFGASWRLTLSTGRLQLPTPAGLQSVEASQS